MSISRSDSNRIEFAIRVLDRKLMQYVDFEITDEDLNEAFDHWCELVVSFLPELA